MINLQNATYIHPNKEVLFHSLNLIVNKQQKIALIGNNGTGKSTLLKIIAGQLRLSSGDLSCNSIPYYIPQLLDEYNDFSVAQALGISEKLAALQEVLNGKMTIQNMETLDEDWSVEERCEQALNVYQLYNLDLNQKLAHLSGGEKTKVFLAGIIIHNPELILMDEPSNHLDESARKLLYEFIERTNKTLIIVSHDRKLLNLIPVMAELTNKGISMFGGNYDFYYEQKSIAQNALSHELQHKQKELNQARLKERDSIERQQKLNATAKKKKQKAGLPKILLNSLKNKAEVSTSKLKSTHQDKINGIHQDISEVRNNMYNLEQMKFGFSNSNLHLGKPLMEAKNLNIEVNGKNLWGDHLNFRINHGDRFVLKGSNGAGKTTLIKLLLEAIPSTHGIISKADIKSMHLDQEYSLLQTHSSIYEMGQSFNNSGLLEHEIKIRLDRFLFKKDDWDKPCYLLSGGEKMRLIICLLNISSQAPDLIILDEPTNNIDIQNITMLTSALNEFQGTLLVVSHDEQFIREISADKIIQL